MLSAYYMYHLSEATDKRKEQQQQQQKELFIDAL